MEQVMKAFEKRDKLVRFSESLNPYADIAPLVGQKVEVTLNDGNKARGYFDGTGRWVNGSEDEFDIFLVDVEDAEDGQLGFSSTEVKTIEKVD